jgi:hypothetical protein
MKTCGVVVVLDGGEWPASCLGRFALGVRAPSTLRIGSWMGHRAGFCMVKGKLLLLAENRTPAAYPIVRRITD